MTSRGSSGVRAAAQASAARPVTGSGAAVVNLAVVALAMHVAPHLLAAALGIVAGASLNFLSNDRLTFRRAPGANRRASAGAGDLAALQVSPVFEEQPVR